MKCLECDRILEDHEAVRKDKSTGDFLDICDDCLGPEFILEEQLEKAKEHDSRTRH